MHYETEIIYPNSENFKCKIFRGARRWEIDGARGLRLTIKEKGKKEHFEGEINFEKTENGWIGKRSYH